MRGINSCAHRAKERVLPTEPQNREFLPSILYLLFSQQLILAHGLDSEDRTLPRIRRDRCSFKTHTARLLGTTTDARSKGKAPHLAAAPVMVRFEPPQENGPVAADPDGRSLLKVHHRQRRCLLAVAGFER